MAVYTPRILGQLLLDMGALGQQDLAHALERQRGSGRRLGSLLLAEGMVEEEALARALATQLGLPFQPAPIPHDPEATALVQPELARARSVLPFAVDSRRLTMAMSDPLDLNTVDDVRFQSGKSVEAVVATESAVSEGLDQAYGGADLERLLNELPEVSDDNASARRDVLEEAARATPVVRLVDHMLHEAVDEDASDVHVEEHQGDVRVRYRVDGVLRSALELPSATRRAVLSRLKIMAGMDIAVKRRPQDGGLRLTHRGRSLTARVSTLPVTGGEKAVVRILDPTKAPSDLGQVGLGADDLQRLRSLLRAGQGVILAAGPTGSGKSSTLYGALQELDRVGSNVVTLEDPVEYRLEGANQVQVDPRAGLTFPSALRSVLRQDPDVVMVGEVRDGETAAIAMAAAVTGHLVLSTIHTTDAPGAITRLLNMGVPPYLVAGGLAGVVAQRLVRRVCSECRGRSSQGCPDCTDGYRGRTGVF